MGAPSEPSSVATQNSFDYTSTKSIFSLSVGSKVGLNVTFLSPVEPSELRRESIPASYMNVDVFSLDGSEHDVQLYSDVSAGTGKTIFVKILLTSFRVGVWRQVCNCTVGL